MECYRKHHAVLDAQRWLLFVVAIGTLSDSAAPSEPADRQPACEVIEQFDVAKDGDVLVLPVTIRDKQYPFFLSIGATRTIIDERLRPLLGKSGGRVEDSVNSIKFDEFPPIPMKIGSQEFTPATPVLCADIGDLRDYYGHDAYGIVGLDFLEGRIVQIDFDLGKFRIFSSFPYNDLPRDAKFEPLTRIIFDGGSYSISLHVPGPAYLAFFNLDTLYSQSLSANPVLMDRLVKSGAVADLQASGDFRSGVVRPNQRRIGLLKWASLGDWKHWNLTVKEEERNRLGLPYLSRFQLTFNFKDHHYVYMAPGTRIDDPELLNWSGMEVILRNGNVTVVHVFRNSVIANVAASAGVEVGDEILELDAHDSRKFSLFEIRQHFMELNFVRVKFRRPERGGCPVSEFVVTLESPKAIAPLSRPATRGNME